MMQKALITGAGFSKPLGLPLGAEVISWLWSRWRNEEDDPFTKEKKLETEFWINQARACGMVGEAVDFEAFLAFLESAESLWNHFRSDAYALERPTNWPDYISWPSNPGSIVKALQGNFLHELSLFHDPAFGGSHDFKPVVAFFAQLLKPGDAILTFNFDSIAETSLFWAFGRGNFSVGKPDRKKISVYHLHGAAAWNLYELPGGRDDDPESTIDTFQHKRGTWKLRRTGGEFALNPYGGNYPGLQNAAVQMMPYKSIPWFLTSQWKYGLESLRGADCVIIIGYSFPLHDSVARFAIRTILCTNASARIINIDPKAADRSHREAVVGLLGPRVEFIVGSWCDLQTIRF